MNQNEDQTEEQIKAQDEGPLDPVMLLYEMAIESEEKNISEDDAKLRAQMFAELEEVGYFYRYIADLTHRNITDPRMYRIVEKYLPLFSNAEIQAELVHVIGKRNNKSCVPLIVDIFRRFPPEINRKGLCGHLDNALARTKSKKYLPIYLELAKDEFWGCELPFTMEFLAKWGVPEMRDLFMKRLSSDNPEAVCHAMRVLHYYWDDEIAERFRKYADWVWATKAAYVYLEHHLYGSPLKF